MFYAASIKVKVKYTELIVSFIKITLRLLLIPPAALELILLNSITVFSKLPTKAWLINIINDYLYISKDNSDIIDLLIEE